MIKANHICKNKNCKNPEYYACDWCAKTSAWRKVTCSPKCYQAYATQWLDAHPTADVNKLEFALPIEIGKTIEQTIQHMAEIEAKPLEQVKEETVKELSELGYSNEIESVGIGGTVALINEELNESAEKVQKSSDKWNRKKRR